MFLLKIGISLEHRAFTHLKHTSFFNVFGLTFTYSKSTGVVQHLNPSSVVFSRSFWKPSSMLERTSTSRGALMVGQSGGNISAHYVGGCTMDTFYFHG